MHLVFSSQNTRICIYASIDTVHWTDQDKVLQRSNSKAPFLILCEKSPLTWKNYANAVIGVTDKYELSIWILCLNLLIVMQIFEKFLVALRYHLAEELLISHIIYVWGQLDISTLHTSIIISISWSEKSPSFVDVTLVSQGQAIPGPQYKLWI